MVSVLVFGTIVIGAAAPAAAAEVKKLAILVPEEPTDYGWNQQAFDAAKAIAAKYNLQFMPASGLGYGDVRPTLRELANDGASLMIAHASGYNTAAAEIGAETKVPVAIVDKPAASKARNGRRLYSQRLRGRLSGWPSCRQDDENRHGRNCCFGGAHTV
jgi:simple sugar transport system substrate-binding protein